MKKAAIVTFHCVPNYGAMLQAYALQRVLGDFFDSVEILDYVPDHLMRQYRYFHFGSIKWFLSCLLNFPFNFVRYGRFNRFMKSYMRLSAKRFRAVAEIETDCDFVFLGSDQIWNFGITGGVDGAYFGAFGKKEGCRVVSYAASFGKDVPEPSELEAYRPLLRNIDSISVREETAQRFIGYVSQKPVSVVLDPTLLLPREEWLKVSRPTRRKGFLLLYSLSGYAETFRLAGRVARERNLRVCELVSGGLSFRDLRGRTLLPFAGPAEFLGLIDAADFVVTDSFHGTAFSVLFNKNFYTVRHRTKGSRMTDLLLRLSLEDRLVRPGSFPAAVRDADFRLANALLECERRRSLSFIESAVSGRPGPDSGGRRP